MWDWVFLHMLKVICIFETCMILCSAQFPISLQWSYLSYFKAVILKLCSADQHCPPHLGPRSNCHCPTESESLGLNPAISGLTTPSGDLNAQNLRPTVLRKLDLILNKLKMFIPSCHLSFDIVSFSWTEILNFWEAKFNKLFLFRIPVWYHP